MDDNISLDDNIPIDKNRKKKLFSEFINLYFELLNIIKSKFNSDNDFKVFYQKNVFLRKTNIKLFIKTWYNSITNLYFNKVMNGDIQYFFDNVNTIIKGDYLKKYFNYFKQVYVTLDEKLIEYVLSIIQKLTKISFLYYKQNNI